MQSDLLTMMQRFAIVEPFDLHVGITNRSQLALELSRFHLNQACLALDLGNETWWLTFLDIVKIILGEEHFGRVLLDCCLHLHQGVAAFHSLRDLVLQDYSWKLCKPN